MKVMKTEYLIRKGEFGGSRHVTEIITDTKKAIESIRWPPGSETFAIYPQEKGNGVVPIKASCMEYLKGEGWTLEKRMSIASREKPGKIDAIKSIDEHHFFAIEWETGNISSSHRALNKICVGMIDGVLSGGILIVPSRKFYKYLTDRVGNFAELEPYFPLWRSIPITNGVLAVIEVEHDAESTQVPKITKGTDGRALR
jgi:hypothetical protein